MVFLVDKRGGRVKVRDCEVGWDQREKIIKEDAASPIVALEIIMFVSKIEAYAEHDVANIDIPGAYLHNENDKHVIMLLRESLEELMSFLYPNIFQKYVTTDQNGQNLIYVKVLKAFMAYWRVHYWFTRSFSKTWKLMDSGPIHTINA